MKPAFPSNNPIISIVIPAYNEESFIGNCLSSLQKQDFKGSYEVIVVDNNSSDRTSEIAQQYGAKIISEQKRGVCAARQAGTIQALGAIIVSTDADNIFAVDWLEKIYQEFYNNPKIIALAGPFKFTNAPWWAAIYTKIIFGFINIVFLFTGKVLYAPASNLAFRKNGFPGYNINLTQGGDELDLLFKLQRMGKISFLKNNRVFTSSRRLSKGPLYSLLVTFISYYAFDYGLSKITGKSILGSYPAIRTINSKPDRYWLLAQRIMVALLIGLIFSHFAIFHAPRSQAMHLMKYTGVKIDNIEDKIQWPR